MQLFSIFKVRGASVNEQCLLTVDGDYIGCQTGTIFHKGDHYCKPRYAAVVISVDQENNTGMTHLDSKNSVFGPNKKEWKERYIGCNITVVKSHMMGELQIYLCPELREYFSADELSVDKYEI